MFKSHKKLKIFCVLYSIILIINSVFVIRQQIERYDKNIVSLESLKIKSIMYIEKTTWNDCYEEFRIDDKEAANELSDYLNSLELIEEPESYFTALREKYVRIYTHSYDITISGNYLSVHKSKDCDCVYTDYYIINSRYNYITGSSTAYNFISKTIRKYGVEIWKILQILML